MIKQGLQQKLLQRLSPQQIQFIKLLQVTTAELEMRVKEELMENPALSEVGSEDDSELVGFGDDNDEHSTIDCDDRDPLSASLDSGTDEDEYQTSLEEYLSGEDDGDYDYKTRQDSFGDEERYEAPIIQTSSLYDLLEEQVGMLELSPDEEAIAHHIIGSIDEDGYMRRLIPAIADDLAFRYNIKVDDDEVEAVLHKIQSLEPAGIGARDLRECLILQLKRKPHSVEVNNALRIITECFEEFTRKHFDKIQDKLGINEQAVRDAFQVITKLNPKPGESQTEVKSKYIIPDFILTVENGEIEIKLNRKNAPELRINKQYRKMLKELDQNHKRSEKEFKETLQFVKAKIDAAQWFIDAIRQRQFTLLKTMSCIADKQREFFLSEGAESKLKPMILKDVADEIGMDISTVSRVANSKYVQTDFGIFQLKFFFSEGITTESGEEVSNKEIKKLLKEMIEGENKKKPLSDDALTKMLNDKGYHIARRTVAKYREQQEIPVARLRKEI